eukprot:GEZU01011062.1.p1 GENE.GEZU01011062.1~~GEZU01011062.1.p1  ORF type:complete len:206 (-),score=42.23 GEZU01011062.1:60-677(-)
MDPLAVDNISFEVRPRAYVKAILHACKYTSCSVNGILIGKVTASGKKTAIQILDAIPLFHSHHSLAPLLEASLLQIESSLEQDEQIVGYYCANELYTANAGFEFAHKTIADKIQTNFDKASVWLIDNSKLRPDSRDPAINVYIKKQQKWARLELGKNTLTWDGSDGTGVVEKTHQAIQAEQYKQLVDFENHFDDIAKDWRNPQIN